jgi:hypothetical protein
MASLYEISSQYLQVLTDLQECDEQTFADTIEGLGIEDDFKSKALNVSSYFQSQEAECEAMRTAERRIAERRKSKERHVERLKNYLLSNMLKVGITAIECPEFVVKVVKCPVSVEIIDELLLPDGLMRIKKEPDKTAIKEWLLYSGELNGAVLVKDKMRLQIK